MSNRSIPAKRDPGSRTVLQAYCPAPEQFAIKAPANIQPFGSLFNQPRISRAYSFGLRATILRLCEVRGRGKFPESLDSLLCAQELSHFLQTHPWNGHVPRRKSGRAAFLRHRLLEVLVDLVQEAAGRDPLLLRSPHPAQLFVHVT